MYQGTLYSISAWFNDSMISSISILTELNEGFCSIGIISGSYGGIIVMIDRQWYGEHDNKIFCDG